MADRYIPEHRRTQFKAKSSFKPEDLRRRRGEQQIEIRKQRREENLAKRRGIQTRDGQVGVEGGAGGLESDEEGAPIETEVRSSLGSHQKLRPRWVLHLAPRCRAPVSVLRGAQSKLPAAVPAPCFTSVMD